MQNAPSSRLRGLAEQPQPRDAAIRIDVQSSVGDRAHLRKLAFKDVLQVRLELGARENFPPLDLRIQAGGV
jgi:hypothetical protein